MSKTAIKLTNVSKRFKLYSNPITGPVKEMLLFWNRKQYYEEFMAVRNLSLEVKRGEVVGIIGPNGAGKTTLLKMIAGLLPVNEGTIKVNGKVTALLALGVGIHPEFTGRENIFYHGMLLGMSKEEVLRKMPETIEFAELGDYIDRPFRTYSSGMKARLLFASSMSIDPDILIVDEALATGDSSFVEKSSQKISELCDSGATILYVSHNLYQIQSLCEKVILMVDGRVFASGNPRAIVSRYYDWTIENEKAKMNAQCSSRRSLDHGSRNNIEIEAVKMLDSNGQAVDHVHMGDTLRLVFQYTNHSLEEEVHPWLWIFDYKTSEEVCFTGTTHALSSTGGRPIKVGRKGSICFDLPSLLLNNGGYVFELRIMTADRMKLLLRYQGADPLYIVNEASPMSRHGHFFHPSLIFSDV